MRSVRRVVLRGRQALRRGYAQVFGTGDEDEAYAQLVLAVLKENGPLPLGLLIDRAAERAMQRDRRGGSEIDIGLWGAQVYRAKIRSVITRMVGRMLALEGDAGAPAVVPVASVVPAA